MILEGRKGDAWESPLKVTSIRKLEGLEETMGLLVMVVGRDTMMKNRKYQELEIDKCPVSGVNRLPFPHIV